MLNSFQHPSFGRRGEANGRASWPLVDLTLPDITRGSVRPDGC